MLEAKRLTVHRPGAPVPALVDVDVVVPDRLVVAVLGPSGSGKTTLLRAVAGLEPIGAGTVAWDGHDLARVPAHRRRFGLMFQDHALFPHRDVIGNVAFGLRMQRLPRAEVDTRARAALARVGLAGFEHRRVRELSGGEQQRVALARALAPEPRLLMLDEPFGSLDRPLRELLLGELRELFTVLQVSALFVTHDQEEAFAIADRVVLLHEGRVEQVGSPAEVWRSPGTERAARFLGFTNLADVTVRAGVAEGPWGCVPVGPAVADGPARLAARPGAVHVDDEGPIAGTVESRTFRRDHFLVRVATVHGSIDVAVPPDGPLEPGTRLRLAVDPDSVVVLRPRGP